MALESTARLHANFKAPFPPLHHPQHTIPYPTGIFRFSPFSPNSTTTLLRSPATSAGAFRVVNFLSDISKRWLKSQKPTEKNKNQLWRKSNTNEIRKQISDFVCGEK